MEIISQHFDALKSIRLKIKHCFHEIDVIKLQVKQYYDTYIQQEPSDYFGLDSFHFQNKSMLKTGCFCKVQAAPQTWLHLTPNFPAAQRIQFPTTHA